MWELSKRVVSLAKRFLMPAQMALYAVWPGCDEIFQCVVVFIILSFNSAEIPHLSAVKSSSSDETFLNQTDCLSLEQACGTSGEVREIVWKSAKL